MNRIKFSIFVLTAIFACAASTSMAQKLVKDAIKHAESVANAIYTEADTVLDIPMEQQCYLLPNDDIFVDDKDGLSFDSQKPAIIPAGYYSFKVRFQNRVEMNTMSGSARSGNVSVGVSYTPSMVIMSDTIPVSAVFEAGKYYTFDYKKYRKGFLKNDSIAVSVVEITDGGLTDGEGKKMGKNLEKMRKEMDRKLEEARKNEERRKEYLAFQEANPNHLDGTWSGEKKRLLNTFFMKYTIEGNKMVFEGKNKHAGMRTLVVEGHIFYNENTIILIPGQVYENGKESKIVDGELKYVWYYTVGNDELFLEGGKLFGKTFIWENNGNLHKINQ